jgi:hypothetical protein
MIYIVKIKKPIEDLLVNLPLKNLVELRMNVDVIKNIKDEKEEANNVSGLCK